MPTKKATPTAAPSFFSRLRSRASARFSTLVPTGSYLDGVPVTSLLDVAALLDMTTTVRVTRKEANSVAAVVAARNRMVAAITGMPLIEVDRQNKAVSRAWLKQPNPNRTLRNELADTIMDLFYDGKAFWRVLERSPFGGVEGAGFPTKSEWVSNTRVDRDPSTLQWRIDGENVREDEIIHFDGLTAGILNEGAVQAIRDSIRLSRAAAMFTNSPMPLGYFTGASEGVDPDDDEVTDFLGRWEQARRVGAYGYVPSSFKFEVPTLDPAKLQLADAKRETVIDVGRGTGAELESLGISTTSRTYFNATQVRQDYLDFAISLFTGVIEDRLSLNDVTPVGHTVEFDFSAFLRTDELTRQKVYQLGLVTGAYADEDEVRAAERKPPLTAAQKASRAARAAPQAADGGRRSTDPGAAPPEGQRNDPAKRKEPSNP